MSKEISNFSITKGSEKSFGIVFSLVFLIVALYPLFYSKGFSSWALFLSAILLFFAIFIPSVLKIPNKLWFKFGIFLGSIIAPIIMALVYFVAILPTGITMRLLKKDLLNQKLDKDAKSYWIVRSDPVGSMKNQF